MPKFGSNEFRTVEEYEKVIETFARFTGVVLFAFARHPLATKDTIIQNFIARTIMMVRGVVSLWDIGNFQDCWILHRSLIDRYFHLVYLGKSDSYDAFDDWSFMRQFEAQNRVRSDPNCRGLLDSPLFKPTPEHRERYASLEKAPPQWKRPRAEEIAKQLNMPFLYTYSYDYASSHVHPMANDGLEAFYTITKLVPKPEFPSQITVLHNTVLIGCLLVVEGLNQSNFKWMKIIYDFYDGVLSSIENGSTDYLMVFTKVALAGPEAEFCEPA